MRTRDDVFVLSIDGGGIRGYIPALLLADIEATVGPVPIFDLFAGTSTGSILAAGMANGESAGVMVKMYEDLGPQIFKKSFWRRMRFLARVHRPLYNNKNLQRILRSTYGQALLGDVQPLLVTAFDITRGRPQFFKSFAPHQGYGGFPLWKIVAASASAPTFFDPIKFNGGSFTDGGTFANNPAMCALDEAWNLFPDRRVHVLSLATGSNHHDYKQGGLGLMNVATVITMFSDGQVAVADHHCRTILRPEQYDRVVPESDVSMDDTSDEAFISMRASAQTITDSPQWTRIKEKCLDFA